MTTTNIRSRHLIGSDFSKDACCFIIKKNEGIKISGPGRVFEIEIFHYSRCIVNYEWIFEGTGKKKKKFNYFVEFVSDISFKVSWVRLIHLRSIIVDQLILDLTNLSYDIKIIIIHKRIFCIIGWSMYPHTKKWEQLTAFKKTFTTERKIWDPLLNGNTHFLFQKKKKKSSQMLNHKYKLKIYRFCTWASDTYSL